MKSSETHYFDVFNGDADGLCALHQLRLDEPRAASLLTGVKHDNALLSHVRARPGDCVTVLDLALEPNRDALMELLGQGVRVEYFDHHNTPEPPVHPLLRLTIDAAPDVCTSVLVNRRLNGHFAAWAVVGAFGDNMPAAAEALADALRLSDGHVQLLKALGECLNYNDYGDSEADLTIPPADLYRLMMPYADPLDFMEKEDAYARLAQRRTDDLMQAMEVAPVLETERALAVLLPDAPWARRIVGSYADRLANRQPGRVCAILVPNTRHALSVSLRAPEGCGVAAGQLARRHGGGGRRTVAGIDNLPREDVDLLLRNLH